MLERSVLLRVGLACGFVLIYAVCLCGLQMQYISCTLAFIYLIVHFFARGFLHFFCVSTVVLFHLIIFEFKFEFLCCVSCLLLCAGHSFEKIK